MQATVTKDINSRKALGRGLAALMPDTPTSATTTASAGFRVLPIERLCPNKTQPRKHFDEEALQELANSIREQGVLQPIVVRRHGEDYEIVAGERRWRAASRAGLLEVPVVVKDYSDAMALQIALVENIQRRDLDPLEEAAAFQRLIKDYKLSHDTIARAVGKSRVAVTNSLRLLNLPPDVFTMLADGRLTPGHARALMMLGDKKMMHRVAEDLVGRGASVREAEQRVRTLLDAKKSKEKKQDKVKAASTPAEASVEEKLQRALGTKVRLVHRHGRGHLEISFHSFEALDTLLDKILRTG